MNQFVNKLFSLRKKSDDIKKEIAHNIGNSEVVHEILTTETQSLTSLDLDQRLIDLFSQTFGEKYRNSLSPDTDMDTVEEWGSLNFLDFVLSIEQAYGLTFSEHEAAQFFQLGHIQRIIRNAELDLPHDDISYACCQLKLLRQAPVDEYKVVVLSGSSTREGFVTASEGLEILRLMSGRQNVGWYNISVSGLVAAETLQLIESIQTLNNGIIAVGYSPIILGGCGAAEFRRAAIHERFHFAALKMDCILADAGYIYTAEKIRPTVSIDTWVERYLKGRILEDLHFEPYLYPTLAPWDLEKLQDVDSILRFYNQSILNYEQSIEINTSVFKTIVEDCRKRDIPLAFFNLTLHSKTLDYLENLGGIKTQTDHVLNVLQDEYELPFIDAVKTAGIVDEDFRDPAHIFRKRQEYTVAAIEGFLRVAPPIVE